MGARRAKALNFSLNHLEDLTPNLLDGDVNVNNDSLENLIRP